MEQNTIRREQIDNKALPKPKKGIEFEAGGDKKYKVEAIIDNAVYGQQANNNQMLGLYYLVLWKGYSEEENTWKPSLAVIHLRKLISTFYKRHSEKPIAIFLLLDSAPPIAKPTVLKKLKQKCGHSNKRANKRGRN